jgi:hypothetical protein
MFRTTAALCALLGLAVALPAHARPGDGAFNEEGFWRVEVEQDGCVASHDMADKTNLAFRAVGGEVTFGVFLKVAVQQGKKGVLATEAASWDFTPTFVGGGRGLVFDGVIEAANLAALRKASQVRIAVDGRTMVELKVAGTGFPGAMDAAIACSKGLPGWWGKGAGQEVPEHAEAI